MRPSSSPRFPSFALLFTGLTLAFLWLVHPLVVTTSEAAPMMDPVVIVASWTSESTVGSPLLRGRLVLSGIIVGLIGLLLGLYFRAHK